MRLQHGIEAGPTCQKTSEAGSFVVTARVLFFPKSMIRAQTVKSYSMSILVRHKATNASELTHVENRLPMSLSILVFTLRYSNFCNVS